MPDVNAPFVCRCGRDRFIELRQVTATCCGVALDPALGRVLMIWCPQCGATYRQTPDWTWEFTPA